MQEESIVRPGTIHQPLHRAKNVVFGGLRNGVLLIVRQDDHILPLVSISLHQELRHVLGVVDAASQLAALPKVVDTDQEGLALARAV